MSTVLIHRHFCMQDSPSAWLRFMNLHGSFIFFKQGVAADHLRPLPTKPPIWSGDANRGANLRTFNNSSIGNRLSQELARLFSNLSTFRCVVVAIWTFLTERSASIFHTLSIPVRCTCIAFAGEMHSKTECEIAVLSKCERAVCERTTCDKVLCESAACDGAVVEERERCNWIQCHLSLSHLFSSILVSSRRLSFLLMSHLT